MALENIDLSKFEKLFSSMERQLIMQSSFLESMYNLAVDEREARISRDNELDVARIEKRARFDQQQSEDGSQPEVTADQRNSLFSSLFSMLPGILGGISLAGAGAFLLSAGLLAAAAPAISDFVAGFIKQGLDGLLPNVGDDAKSAIADALSDAAIWGTAWKLLSKVFGKKIAGIFAVGGFLYNQFSKWLDPNGENKELMVGLAAAGTAVASFIPKVIKNIFSAKTPAVATAPGAAATTPKPTAEPAPKASKGFLSSATKVLKNLGKSLPALSGVLAAGTEYAESGDVSAAASAGIGATAGTIIGGAIGSLIGPLGTFAGGVAGAYVGEAVGGGFNEWAQQPTESAAPPVVGSYTAPAEQPNRRTALEGQQQIEADAEAARLKAAGPAFKQANRRTAFEDQQKIEADAEVARLKAAGLYGDYVPPPVSTTPAEMAIPGVSFGPNGEIIRPSLTPPTPISPAQSKLDKLEQLYYKELNDKKSAPTSMNSFSNPTTIGGATNITNNNTTYHIASSASQSLDQAIIM